MGKKSKTAKPKFYASWTQGEVLALVLKGIRSGRIKDQSIIHTAPEAIEADIVPLSTIIQHVISRSRSSTEEHQPSKPVVAGSNPVANSTLTDSGQ